mmetsp:Transcript_15711/g.36334  ORF Transcript_15711/g.36334 Transcript_15711/m.36334 type:complete len:384 (-) Transcript_15711:163-1314(-)|eukprot:CAMPEP_0197173856 /NCGR_PEP_ID=MMETSP1423-20130617/623_1 /TAXON_ID=476441 /ORGANISM="Pseudo-nitzschia heimii, Strain UNC1101" /LENGTH=383 /DNA_ID=CAMNT_0042622725 /DNA_START=236 /DNA_END=1387 /DNA_ORIENTATION=+
MKISSAATSAFLLLAGGSFRGSTAFAPSNQGPVSSQLSMVQSGTLPCRPIGVGHAAPKTIVTNTDLESVVETDDEWIRTRTGIAQRRVLTSGESLRELGIEAGKQALEMAGVSAEDIDVVICATSSPEDMFGDATAIAHEVGCSTHTMAFDLTAACSGFLFGSVTAGQFLSSPNTKLKNALVIGADALSRCVDWEDRNACILFGDGAGAMVVTNQPDEDCEDETKPGLLGYAAHSNGAGYPDLNCLYKGDPVSVSTPEPITLESGSYNNLAMNGQSVYKFATREVPRVVSEALEEADMTPDDVDWLLLHQANIRIMDVVAKRLKIPKEKIITNLASYGNTSAGSIPIALSEAVRSGQVKKGDVIACAGFGAGLSWGSAILRWG